LWKLREREAHQGIQQEHSKNVMKKQNKWGLTEFYAHYRKSLESSRRFRLPVGFFLCTCMFCDYPSLLRMNAYMSCFVLTLLPMRSTALKFMKACYEYCSKEKQRVFYFGKTLTISFKKLIFSRTCPCKYFFSFPLWNCFPFLLSPISRQIISNWV